MLTILKGVSASALMLTVANTTLADSVEIYLSGMLDNNKMAIASISRLPKVRKLTSF